MLGLIELFVVFAFVIGWAVVELVALRYDRRRRSSSEAEKDDDKKSTP